MNSIRSSLDWLPATNRDLALNDVISLCATPFNKEETWVVAYQIASRIGYAQVLAALEKLAGQIGLPGGLAGWAALAGQMGEG